jgi:UDP-N-acetylglucosamine 2-epimerase (non-hydrolysing)
VARPMAEARGTHRHVRVDPFRYGLVTLHRPSNVDSKAVFSRIVDTLIELSRLVPLVLPMHPRTRKNLEAFGLEDKVSATPSLRVIPP